MITNNKCIEFYSGTYKKGLLGKKYDQKLFVYAETVEGVGYSWYENELSSEPSVYKIEIDEIKEVTIKDLKGEKGILIEYIPKNSVVRTQKKYQFIMGIEKKNEAVALIESIKTEYINRKRQQDEAKKQEENEHNLRIQQEEENAKQFYNDCYSFHISKNENPHFDLLRDNLEVALIYIDKSKNLNFLRIDGNSQDESNAVIPFSKIHYYERAGSIHYTTEINGTYSSYGGSITGGTFSKKATFWAGLLLGPMGMAGGALFTHKPAKVDIPSTDFNLESTVTKVDDRNVILNYYSDLHKQYIDIELPKEIYNFLQTHLAEKKYEIVMELEKKGVVSQSTKQIEIDEEIKVHPLNTHVDDFKIKLEKLKMMFDMGILTDSEFEIEKKKLLESL